MGCKASKNTGKPAGAKPAGSTVGKKMCAAGCGLPAAEGQTYCCKRCELAPRLDMHTPTCGQPWTCIPVTQRLACDDGCKCKDRSEEHLKKFAHPLDKDYAEATVISKIPGEKMTLRTIFDWADADRSGKLSRQEVETTMKEIDTLFPGKLPKMSEASWKALDDDGNGVVNFNEFASWGGPRLGLPLGMERLVRTGSTVAAGRPCGVIGCPCEQFTCGKSNPFSAGSEDVCSGCKHHKVHHGDSNQTSDADVPYPEYWDNQNGSFKQIIEVPDAVREFQELLDKTYKTRATRDRKRHNPDRPNVPDSFKVRRVFRNENSDIWREFGCRRAAAVTRYSQEPITAIESKTSAAWKEIAQGRADRLAKECNEWYLFHGTNTAAAESICTNDFRVSCAGSNTGTLYGRGLYFAESISKADEYAKPNDEGHYAMLFCRIIGGNVQYNDEHEPDPEALVASCLAGKYDTVLGDREKLKGTYKEYVIFDSEDVYPEYVIHYSREYKD